jgi:hypothetical protein
MSWNWFRSIANVTLVLVALACIGVISLLFSGYHIRSLIMSDGNSVALVKNDLDAFETSTNDRFDKLTDATVKLADAVSVGFKKDSASIDSLTDAVNKMSDGMRQDRTNARANPPSDTLTQRVDALEARLKAQEEALPPPRPAPVAHAIETCQDRRSIGPDDIAEEPMFSSVTFGNDRPRMRREGSWTYTMIGPGEESKVFRKSEMDQRRVGLNLTHPVKAHVWYSDGYLLGYKWNRDIDIPVGGITLPSDVTAMVFYSDTDTFEIGERDP